MQDHPVSRRPPDSSKRNNPGFRAGGWFATVSVFKGWLNLISAVASPRPSRSGFPPRQGAERVESCSQLRCRFRSSRDAALPRRACGASPPCCGEAPGRLQGNDPVSVLIGAELALVGDDGPRCLERRPTPPASRRRKGTMVFRSTGKLNVAMTPAALRRHVGPRGSDGDEPRGSGAEAELRLPRGHPPPGTGGTLLP